MVIIAKKCLFLLLLILGWGHNSCATPASIWKLPDPVAVSVRFLPGHSPNINGDFEIEIYCKARFNLDSIEIAIGHSEEIIFNKDLPSFIGSIRAGQAKIWRLKGVVKNSLESRGDVVPRSITLGVRYLFPYEAGLKYVEERYKNRVETLLGSNVPGQDTNGPKDQYSEHNIAFESSEYVRRLNSQKGRTLSVIKVLPVRLPK